MYDDSRNNYHSLFWQKWDGTPSTDMIKLKILLKNLTDKADSEECIINDILDKLITDVQIYGHNPELRLKQKKYFLTCWEKMTTKTKAALEELKNTVQKNIARTEEEKKGVITDFAPHSPWNLSEEEVKKLKLMPQGSRRKARIEAIKQHWLKEAADRKREKDKTSYMKLGPISLTNKDEPGAQRIAAAKNAKQKKVDRKKAAAKEAQKKKERLAAGKARKASKKKHYNPNPVEIFKGCKKNENNLDINTLVNWFKDAEREYNEQRKRYTEKIKARAPELEPIDFENVNCWNIDKIISNFILDAKNIGLLIQEEKNPVDTSYVTTNVAYGIKVEKELGEIISKLRGNLGKYADAVILQTLVRQHYSTRKENIPSALKKP